MRNINSGFTVFFAAGSALLGLLIGLLTKTLDLRQMAYGFGALLTVVVVSAVIVIAFSRDKIRSDLDSTANELSSIVKRLEGSIELANSLRRLFAPTSSDHSTDSLVTHRELVDIESRVPDRSQIWVLTSSFMLENEDLREVIRTNLRRGVIYKYLIPLEDSVLCSQMDLLFEDWKRDANLTDSQAKDQLSFVAVPRFATYMTVIAYDAVPKPPHAPTVLVKLPTSKEYPAEKYPLVYRIDPTNGPAWKTMTDCLSDLLHLPSAPFGGKAANHKGVFVGTHVAHEVEG
jgi:hypothetical protein